MLDKSIMDIMSWDESLLEDHNHRSSFLHNSNSIEPNFVSPIISDIVENTQTRLCCYKTNSKGNLCNITQTTPIDISVKPGIVEHVHLGQNCSTKEIEMYKALFKEFQDVFSWMYE